MRTNAIRAWPAVLIGAAIGLAGGLAVSAGDSGGPPAHRVVVRTADPGWLGSLSGQAAQSGTVTLPLPGWGKANLIVMMAALDGPDSPPSGTATSETTAIIGGTSGLRWTRLAHLSARQDWSTSREPLEQHGASAAEIWVAVPPPGWAGTSTVTVADSHPLTRDDGFAVTVAAYASGQIDGIQTLDGLASRPDVQRLSVPGCSSVYAAVFWGRRDAPQTAELGYHIAVQRRAGDDTASVLAPSANCLPASEQTVGFLPPGPGDFWEMAVIVIGPAS